MLFAQYLKKIARLDEMFLKIYEQINQANEAWFTANENFSPDDQVLKDAHSLLKELEIPALDSLNLSNWVAHTCYDQRAEKNLAYEMNARNKASDGEYFGTAEASINLDYYGRRFKSHEYHLETAKTQTDFAIEVLKKIQTTNRLKNF
jgi:hypothetical protein